MKKRIQSQYKSLDQKQHRPSVREALEKAGVSADNYLSLRINKNDLPDGSELVIQVRDRRTGKLVTLPLNDDGNPYFGKKSRFYGRVMADGHVFNPYIHRRFIASQFRQLVKSYGLPNVERQVAKLYDWNYALEQVCGECRKLALLRRRDPEAYEERRIFYSLSDMKDILSCYVQDALQVIDRAAAISPKAPSFYVRNYGMVLRSNLRPMRYSFTQFSQDVARCHTYEELHKLLEDFEFLDLGRTTGLLLPECFTERYTEAGAYFTLKHAIMFENLRLDNRDQRQSLDYLLETARRRSYLTCRDLYARYA